jgi:hypothetical protein
MLDEAASVLGLRKRRSGRHEPSSLNFRAALRFPVLKRYHHPRFSVVGSFDLPPGMEPGSKLGLALPTCHPRHLCLTPRHSESSLPAVAGIPTRSAPPIPTNLPAAPGSVPTLPSFPIPPSPFARPLLRPLNDLGSPKKYFSEPIDTTWTHVYNLAGTSKVSLDRWK